MIFLYVKQHSITGVKYFGRTIRSNPFKYNGSGKYWINHINKYGKEHIRTIELYGFDTQKLCSEFALNFSKDNNIVESKEWANMIEETGEHWWPIGGKLSQEVKDKISQKNKGKKRTEIQRKRISDSLIGYKQSDEHKQNL